MPYRLLLPALAATCLCQPAQAGTSSGVMPVTATAVTACAVSALPLAFGTISQLSGAPSDATTSVTVSCSPGVNYNVGLDQGAHATGGVRSMHGVLSSDSIPYRLYTSASRTTEWGTTIGADTVSGTSSATPTTLTVYGRIPGNAALVAAGAYTDTVTVTVTF